MSRYEPPKRPDLQAPAAAELPAGDAVAELALSDNGMNPAIAEGLAPFDAVSLARLLLPEDRKGVAVVAAGDGIDGAGIKGGKSVRDFHRRAGISVEVRRGAM